MGRAMKIPSSRTRETFSNRKSSRRVKPRLFLWIASIRIPSLYKGEKENPLCSSLFPGEPQFSTVREIIGSPMITHEWTRVTLVCSKNTSNCNSIFLRKLTESIELLFVKILDRELFFLFYTRKTDLFELFYHL